jgi:DNA-binding beta-propeller fold protein YncE
VSLAMERCWMRAIGIAVLAVACQDGAGPQTRAQQISVTPSFLYLIVGTSEQLAATVRAADGSVVTSASVTFASSDTTVVGVSANGLVTAKGAGMATIVVRSGAASANVGVQAVAPPLVAMTPRSAALTIGDSVTFTVRVYDYDGAEIPATGVAMTSSDSRVAVPGGTLGRVYAVGAGAAWISAAAGPTRDSASVTVYGPPATVEASPDSLALLVGSGAPVSAQVRDAAGHVLAQQVTYRSLNTAVAEVDQTGLVRVTGIGLTGIVAECDTLADTVPVLGMAAIDVEPRDVMLEEGDSVQLSVTARDAGGYVLSGVVFTYQSSDPSVVQVTPAGYVRWAGVGNALVVVEGGYDRDSVAVLALVARIPLGGRPYGVAVSAVDVVYVTQLDAGTVTRLDPATWTPLAAPFVGAVPVGVTFDAAGTSAYVTCESPQWVAALDVPSNTVRATLAVPGDPFVARVVLGDSLLYVTTNHDKIYGVDLATGALVDSLPGLSNGLVARDSLLYASLFDDGQVLEYNLRTRAVTRTFATGGVPQGLELSANGRELYVADQSGMSTVQVWDLTSGTRVGSVTDPGGGAFGVARQPGTGFVFATQLWTGNIVVVDPTTRAVVRVIRAGGDPRGIAFLGNGDAIVANQSFWVDILR